MSLVVSNQSLWFQIDLIQHSHEKFLWAVVVGIHDLLPNIEVQAYVNINIDNE